jgi:hypothetical protein
MYLDYLIIIGFPFHLSLSEPAENGAPHLQGGSKFPGTKRPSRASGFQDAPFSEKQIDIRRGAKRKPHKEPQLAPSFFYALTQFVLSVSSTLSLDRDL